MRRPVPQHDPNNYSGPVNEVGKTSPDDAKLLREASTCTGNAAKKILASRVAGSLRLGVEIHNADGTYELWVYPVPRDDTAPTISSTDRNFCIQPKTTLALSYGSEIDIYVMNSSGAATTSNYVATEVRR